MVVVSIWSLACDFIIYRHITTNGRRYNDYQIIQETLLLNTKHTIYVVVYIIHYTRERVVCKQTPSSITRDVNDVSITCAREARETAEA